MEINFLLDALRSGASCASVKASGAERLKMFSDARLLVMLWLIV
jgi:hypothetical protein